MRKRKYVHPANPERAKAMHDLARSNASGTHEDRRFRRKRTRRAAKKAAIEDAV